MNITEAANYFEVRAEGAKWKHQKKFYTKFSAVLMGLLKKDLNSNQIAEIEGEIDKMNLDSANPQKNYQYTRKYNYFTKYLVEKLDLIPVKYYEERYLSLGMVFGMLVGMIVSYTFQGGGSLNQGFIFGMPFGMIAGMLWGKRKDKAAEESGQVLGAS